MANTRVRHCQLVLAHRSLNESVQALRWRHVVLDKAEQSRFIRSVTRWNEGQREARLACVRTLRLRGGGMLANYPEILSHMG